MILSLVVKGLVTFRVFERSGNKMLEFKSSINVVRLKKRKYVALVFKSFGVSSIGTRSIPEEQLRIFFLFTSFC